MFFSNYLPTLSSISKRLRPMLTSASTLLSWLAALPLVRADQVQQFSLQSKNNQDVYFPGSGTSVPYPIIYDFYLAASDSVQNFTSICQNFYTKCFVPLLKNAAQAPLYYSNFVSFQAEMQSEYFSCDFNRFAWPWNTASVNGINFLSSSTWARVFVFPSFNAPCSQSWNEFNAPAPDPSMSANLLKCLPSAAYPPVQKAEWLNSPAAELIIVIPIVAIISCILYRAYKDGNAENARRADSGKRREISLQVNQFEEKTAVPEREYVSNDKKDEAEDLQVPLSWLYAHRQDHERPISIPNQDAKPLLPDGDEMQALFLGPQPAGIQP